MISTKEVQAVAKEAKIGLTKVEEEKIQQDISQWLQQIHQPLETIEIPKEVESMVSPCFLTNVLRKDEVIPFVRRDQLLKNVPQTQKGYFYVPRVL
ncbi:MAG: Asp-tRNA(Asn)/Glu-tRNA(Gln) amidotransferase subunit GatC [Epulopiscium sp.]|nr:Asp-tRNA(Asn)/Glu-tRNA(Gln) amidotransferase subunit GatC [Candidatus Epulonipiscium sp.]